MTHGGKPAPPPPPPKGGTTVTLGGAGTTVTLGGASDGSGVNVKLTGAGNWAMASGMTYSPATAAISTMAKHMAAPVNNAPTQAVRI